MLFRSKTVLGLSERLVKNRLNVGWRVCSRIDSLSDEKLVAAKEAGCWDLILGLESGSDRILAYMNKRITVDMMMRGIDKVLHSGLSFTANFMFGLPEETMEDMRATLDLIKRIPAGNIAVYRFIPLPGTKFYNDVAAMGMFGKDGPGYEYLDLYSDHYHYSRHVSREEINAFAREIYSVVEEKNRLTRSRPPRPLADDDFPFLKKTTDVREDAAG